MVLLISFSDCPLLVYRNIWLIFVYQSCILQPCWTCLLILINFVVDSSGFSVNSDSFTSLKLEFFGPTSEHFYFIRES